MDRLSPLDASFLFVEGAGTPMHIACVAVCAGPPPSYDELSASIASKLQFIPRYRQKVRFVPFGLMRPVWVDDPHFNLDYHLRHTALPPPGGRDELRALVGRVMAQHLDRHKPLWEVWVVEGLGDDTWAILTKVHHCMVDGIAGSDLMAVLFDLTPDAPRAEPGSWEPDTEPDDARLLLEAVRDIGFLPREQIRVLRTLSRMPAKTLAEVGKGVRNWLRVVERTPPTSLTGPSGPHRRWDFAHVSLPRVKDIAHAAGVTVNDVVMTAVTKGFRDLLLARDEDPTEARIRSFVPVSLRRPDERNRLDNRVAGMIAVLPVDVDDPVGRLDRVREQMGALKQSGEPRAAALVEELAVFAPPAILAWGERAAARLGQGPMTTVTTNVPGPQLPLYVCGRRLVELYPYVGIGGGTRLNVAVFSYDGHLGFGITGDWESAPDIGILTRGITSAVDELESALL